MSQLKVDCDMLAKVGLVRLFLANKPTLDVLPNKKLLYTYKETK